nr:globin domain-containing protein [Streptomyces sp. SID14478]
MVQDSLQRAGARGVHVVRFFYAHLFGARPDLRRLFPAELGEQHERLLNALVHVIDHLDAPGTLSYLERLGRDHRRYGITRSDYLSVGRSLIASIAEHTPRTWNEDTERAWTNVYTLAMNTMLAAVQRDNAAGIPASWRATVVSRRLDRTGHTVVLQAVPDQSYPFCAGQYAAVHHPELRGIWRPYSLVRPDDDASRGEVELHVARTPDGSLSTLLCDQASPGHTLTLSAPAGDGWCAQDEAPLTVIAAGTGWAPARAIVAEQLRRCPSRTIDVHVVARSRDHFYDRQRLAGLESRHRQLTCHWWYPPDPRRVRGFHDQFQQRLAEGPCLADRHVYVAGPPALVSTTIQTLEQRNAPRSLTHDPLLSTRQDQRSATHAERVLDPPQPRWINPSLHRIG